MGGFSGGASGPRPLFGFFYRIFVTNHLSSSDIVQSAQGCSCVVGMQQYCVLTKNVSEFSGLTPEFLDFTSLTATILTIIVKMVDSVKIILSII